MHRCDISQETSRLMPEHGTETDRYTIQVLKDLVGIDSTNPPGREERIALYMADRLRELGAEVHVDQVGSERANAIGIFRGRKNKPTLVLNGHVDTVPWKEGWRHSPFEGKVEGNRLYGLGAADMKGALAAMMGAYKAVREDGDRKEGTVILSFVADEERGNAGTNHFLSTYKDLDYAIIGEPTDLRIVTSHRGVMRYRITTYGKAGHASRPAGGINAIYLMNRVVGKLEELAESWNGKKGDYFEKPSVAVTTIEGGTGQNVIPDSCEIVIDRRALHDESLNKVRGELEAVMAQVNTDFGDFRYKIEPITEVRGWKADHRSPLVGLGSRTYEKVFGKKPELGDLGATCEATLFADAGVDAFIFGPGSIERAHTVDEYVEIDQLFQARDYYRELINMVLG